MIIHNNLSQEFIILLTKHFCKLLKEKILLWTYSMFFVFFVSVYHSLFGALISHLSYQNFYFLFPFAMMLIIWLLCYNPLYIHFNLILMSLMFVCFYNCGSFKRSIEKLKWQIEFHNDFAWVDCSMFNKVVMKMSMRIWLFWTIKDMNNQTDYFESWRAKSEIQILFKTKNVFWNDRFV